MRRVTRVAALCLIVSLPLVAQDPAAPASAEFKTSFGVGVTINPTMLLVDESIGFFPVGIGNILLPMRVSPRVTIEPEFGVFRSSTDQGGFSSKFNSTRLGVGLLLGLSDRGALRPYIGPRFGWNQVTSEADFGGGPSETKVSLLTFGGVLGAQHFFSENFALGGEVQLSRSSGDIEDPSNPAATNMRQTAVTTTAVATLRWFF